MARIEYSPIALLDIEQIGDYIEQEYMNPIDSYFYSSVEAYCGAAGHEYAVAGVAYHKVAAR